MKKRLQFALKACLSHLALSIIIAGISALFVFYVLYPKPYNLVLGISGVYTLIIAVDIVCGPLLTLAVASPNKQKKELYTDLSFIIIIQFMALIYGMYTTYINRPVAEVFEMDRFVVVTANEVRYERLDKATDEYKRIPALGQLKVHMRQPYDSDDRLESIELSLSGMPPSVRPDWWKKRELDEIKNAAKDIQELQKKFKDTQNEALLNKVLQKHPNTTNYLPYTTSKDLEWTVLLDKDMNQLSHIHLDGF